MPNIKHDDFFVPDINDDLLMPAPHGAQSAAIIPFPISRMTRHVDSLRKRAATFPRKGRQWLIDQVTKHQQRLMDLGVDAELVESEARDMTAMLFPAAPEKARA